MFSGSMFVVGEGVLLGLKCPVLVEGVSGLLMLCLGPLKGLVIMFVGVFGNQF